MAKLLLLFLATTLAEINKNHAIITVPPQEPTCMNTVGDLCEGRICIQDDDCFINLVCSSIYYVCEKPIVLKKIKLKIEKSSREATKSKVARAIGLSSKVYRTPFETEKELHTFITIFYSVAIVMIFLFVFLIAREILREKD